MGDGVTGKEYEWGRAMGKEIRNGEKTRILQV